MEKTVPFSQRLTQLLQEHQLSVTQFAQSIGLSKQAISSYCTGVRTPKQPTIDSIARKLGVNPKWLMGYAVPKQTADSLDSFALPDNLIPLPEVSQTVPLLGNIACGSPIFAQQNVEALLPLPEFVRADFALRCKGDSMIEARIFDGDFVYIRQQADVDNGEIAAVLIEEEATLKRVYKQPNQLILQPANGKYAPLVYTDQQLESVKILGKAVYFVSAVR